MRLESDHAVIHLNARLLQIARPTNIGGFVEPRLELDDHSDLFFRGGVDQSADNRRVLAGAVERLLDGEDVRVLRGAFNETDDSGIRIVGMVEKELTLANQLEYRGRAGFQRQFAGSEWRKLQVRARRLVVHVEEPGEIYRAIDAENLPGREAEIRLEAVNDLLIRADLDFQAHGGAFAAAVELRIHGVKKAARFLFFQIQIAIARDAEGGGGRNFISVIEALGKGMYHIVEENVFSRSFRRRQENQARERPRNGDDSEIGVRVAALALEQKGQAEGFIEDVRKWMRGVHRYRSEQRLN